METGTSKRSHKLQELLRLQDEAFVRKAYQHLLGRGPDKGGLEHSLMRLRRGDDRMEIIADLRHSDEGQNVGIVFPELDRLVAPYRKRPSRLIRKFLKFIGRPYGISADQRRINILENQLARISSDYTIEATPIAAADSVAQTASRKVMGNVAVAAKAWSENVAVGRILLIKLDHFGDFFVAVRAFTMIREAWPKAHITLVCGSWNVRLAQQLAVFDEILPFDMPLMLKKPELTGRDAWVKQCEGILELNLGRYDLAVDLRHDLDTRPCLLFVDAPYKAGYENSAMPPWPNGQSPINITLHQSDIHAELRCTTLAQLVINTLSPPEKHPIHSLAGQTHIQLPFPPGSYVVVSTSAAEQNRTWPADNFSKLIQKIEANTNYKFIFIGSFDDRSDIEYIARNIPKDSYINLAGSSFDSLPSIFVDAAIFIGCDSGPGHLASLLGVPTLSIYGGVSPPEIWQPLGPHVSIVHSQTPCAYCSSKICAYDFRCMNEIKVEDVFLKFSEIAKL